MSPLISCSHVCPSMRNDLSLRSATTLLEGQERQQLDLLGQIYDHRYRGSKPANKYRYPAAPSKPIMFCQTEARPCWRAHWIIRRPMMS